MPGLGAKAKHEQSESKATERREDRGGETERAPQRQASGGASQPEQAAYNEFVRNAMKIIYNRDMIPKILQGIRSDNPVQGLANVVGLVMKRVDDAATKAGRQMTPKVRAAAAKEVLEMVAELAGQQGAGIHDFTKEELGAAYQMASQIFNGAGGQAAPQEQQQQQQGPPQTQPPAPAQQPGAGGGLGGPAPAQAGAY